MVDFTGKKLDGQKNPPRESIMHAIIYRERADVNGVVHSHPPMAVALASTGRGLPLYNQTAVFHDRCPIFETPDLIGTEELALALARKLDQRVAVMIWGHGATTVGNECRRRWSTQSIGEELANAAAGTCRRKAEPLDPAYAKGYVKTSTSRCFNISGITMKSASNGENDKLRAL